MYGVVHPEAPKGKPEPAVGDTNAITVVQPQPLGTDSSVSRDPLPLVLTATRLGRNAQEGYADIGVNALSPQTYRAGALLANGAHLEGIYADYVVLERNGRRTPLYVLGHAGPGPTRSPTSNALLTVGGTVPRATAVADNHDPLFEIMRVAPIYDEDTLRALEVYGSEHSDAFARLGLQPGDRITSIDGAELTSTGEALSQLRQITEGASLSVTIERSGKRQTLSLDGSIVRTSHTQG